MALAPSADLLAVPSSLHMAASMDACLVTSMFMSSLDSGPTTAATARRTPLPP